MHENGIRQLACNPVNEAANYLNVKRNSAILGRLHLITTPVTLLRARVSERPIVDFSTSPTWPDLASALPDCRDVYLPELDHFIPMQDPELVASYIRQALEMS
jgi:pimeloyl-ACP methyl ester carboxylesterase